MRRTRFLLTAFPELREIETTSLRLQGTLETVVLQFLGVNCTWLNTHGPFFTERPTL